MEAGPEGIWQKLTPILLNEENYIVWSGLATTSICGRGQWKHIEPTQTPPCELDESYPKWFQEDQMVKGWILASLEPRIFAAYCFCKSAKDLWEALELVFGDKFDLCRVYEIKKRLDSLKQDSSLTAYLMETRGLLAELKYLRPPTSDISIIMEREDQDNVFALLSGLKPVFKPLIHHILRMDKLPSFNDVVSLIRREEASLRFVEREIGGVVAKAQVQDKKVVSCEHCKKLNHTKEMCWELHPPNKTKHISRKMEY